MVTMCASWRRWGEVGSRDPSLDGLEPCPLVAVTGDEAVAAAVRPHTLDLDTVPGRRHDDRTFLAPRRRRPGTEAHVAQAERAAEQEPGQVGVERPGDGLLREPVVPVLVDVGEAGGAEGGVALLEHGGGAFAVAFMSGEDAQQGREHRAADVLVSAVEVVAASR